MIVERFLEEGHVFSFLIVVTGLGKYVRPIEQGAAFCFIPPATFQSPENQNDTMAKDALLMGNFISAESVRSIRQG